MKIGKIIEGGLAVIGGIWVAGKIWDAVDVVKENIERDRMRELGEDELDNVSGGKRYD